MDKKKKEPQQLPQKQSKQKTLTQSQQSKSQQQPSQPQQHPEKQLQSPQPQPKSQQQSPKPRQPKPQQQPSQLQQSQAQQLLIPPNTQLQKQQEQQHQQNTFTPISRHNFTIRAMLDLSEDNLTSPHRNTTADHVHPPPSFWNPEISNEVADTKPHDSAPPLKAKILEFLRMMTISDRKFTSSMREIEAALEKNRLMTNQQPQIKNLGSLQRISPTNQQQIQSTIDIFSQNSNELESLIQWNINGFRSHFEDLKILANERNATI